MHRTKRDFTKRGTMFTQNVNFNFSIQTLTMAIYHKGLTSEERAPFNLKKWYKVLCLMKSFPHNIPSKVFKELKRGGVLNLWVDSLG
jgi:hypothetical protein